MTIIVNIEPKLETQLRHEAAKHGLDINDYVVNAVQERLLRDQKNEPPRLSKKESELLQKINIGLSQEVWQRYRELIEKRQDENLIADEQNELIKMSDRLEEINASRMEHLLELAQVRGIPLRVLMEQLGIKPTNV